MTKYLDEYNPTGRGLNYHAQADASKLKFNNIQSCIAVVLAPDGGNTMAGIHLTTKSTADLGELRAAVTELRDAVPGQTCDAYLVATFKFHAGTPLVKELKRVARSVYLCDVTPTDAVIGGADVDVKFELLGGRMVVHVREHAKFLETRADGSAGRTPNPSFKATSPAGKPRSKTDRDGKLWIPVSFAKLS